MDILIYNGYILNNNQTLRGSILLSNGKIKQLFPDNKGIPTKVHTIDATGKFVLPGAIDTHVHFREPGLTHKATIMSESRAAMAGGVTSFFDMPNTLPPTTTAAELRNKIEIARKTSAINYSFYMAATKDNIQEIKQIPQSLYAGVKIFYAPTTGNLLCNNLNIIDKFFRQINKPFAIHSEDLEILTLAGETCKKLKPPLPEDIHVRCRPSLACYKATETLINLASQTTAKVHFLHITTKQEIDLLRKNKNPRISAEACPHYLWFSSDDYAVMGNLIKVNPAIKTPQDRQALINALKNKVIGTIGTDHAPHLLDEKKQPYFQAPSGVPSVQHYYPAIFQLFENHNIPFSSIPFFTAHSPAQIFGIKQRGFLEPGAWADIAIVERKKPIAKNIFHKCGWSVFQDQDINYRVFATIINGQIGWLNGKFYPTQAQQVDFNP